MNYKKNSLVSIIIPVYNGSNYLKESINSAINQTYENIEILIVNDGSTDNGATEKIALSFGKKVRYFVKTNGGVSSALNYGIEKCNGDFIAWLSHDDIFEKNNIMMHLEQLKEKKSVVSACKTGLLIDNCYIKNKETKKVVIYDKPLDHWNQWLYACSLLIPKNIIISVGCLNEDNKTSQDTELVWNILRKFKIIYFDTVCVYRREHAEQGVNLNAINNYLDSAYLLKKTIEEKGIDFFVSSLNTNDLKKLKVYLFLAWQYQKDRRNVQNDIPEFLFKECEKDIDSYFNPLFLFSKYPLLFKQINWKYYDFRQFLSTTYKKIKSIISK